MGSLAPNQLLILNGVNTNLISRSLHNVLTKFLILRFVMMEEGPMYGKLIIFTKNCPYEQHSERNRVEVIVKTFSNNILDNTRRE